MILTSSYSRIPRVCFAATLLLVTSVASPGQVTLADYPIPTPGSFPELITAGPDGSLWFTEENAYKVGRITTSGTITEFPVPFLPGAITTGPDGSLWLTDYFGQAIWRMSTAGVLASFPVPGGSYPGNITSGPDGNLWFTARLGNYIGRMTTSGALIGTFPVPTPFPVYGPHSITPGPDGNLWFTEEGANQIGRVTTSGVITEFPIPTSGAGPQAITSGPDGNLWFTEGSGPNNVARITIAGTITEFAVPISGQPSRISVGPDGNLWFTEISAINQLGRLTPTGVITMFSVPTPGNGDVRGITLGPDGNLWFAESSGNRIGKAEVGPRYSVCLLYDPTKPVKSGAVIPIKLQLCDVNGNNLSSAGLAVHAISVTRSTASISGDVQDAGNANPDNDFRFDAALGSTGGYIFNLKTAGLTTGSYNLNFTVAGDSSSYAAPFQVK